MNEGGRGPDESASLTGNGEGLFGIVLAGRSGKDMNCENDGSVGKKAAEQLSISNRKHKEF